MADQPSLPKQQVDAPSQDSPPPDMRFSPLKGTMVPITRFADNKTYPIPPNINQAQLFALNNGGQYV